MQLFADLYDDLVSFPKPTVAVCHGATVGGGAEVAVACDIRVGGSNMRLRFPGASLGVPVGPARLVTLCGLSVAKYLLISGKEVAADEALRWGLVHKVAPAAAAEAMAIDLATTAASHPPEAVARLKADAPRMGRRRRALEGRGRGPGRVAAHRSRPSISRLSRAARRSRRRRLASFPSVASAHPGACLRRPRLRGASRCRGFG